MALFVGSAMKEDLERERRKYDDDSLAVGSAMKEDLARDNEDPGPLAISGAMKEDLKHCRRKKK